MINQRSFLLDSIRSAATSVPKVSLVCDTVLYCVIAEKLELRSALFSDTLENVELSSVPVSYIWNNPLGILIKDLQCNEILTVS